MSADPREASGGPAAAPGVQDALAAAGRHARRAASESILALRALLDAVALLQGGVPAESHRALERVAAWLEALAGGVAPDGASDAALTRALAEALDAEIARWELRAQQDPDARAVLRAFLGVRELLWELGVRPPQPEDPAPEPGSRAPKDRAGREGRGGPRKRRVERVPVRSDRPDPVG